MSEEKKLDEKTGATALDDAALEAVSGGEKKLPMNYWAEKSLDDLAVWTNLYSDNDTEQQL